MNKWEIEVAKFAKAKHKGQVRDGGKTYYTGHIVPVVSILKQITKDRDTITAGYLHDIYEKTSVTYYEIRVKFGVNVAELVKEVTNRLKDDTPNYFPDLFSKKAILIKFADRLQNLSDMEAWSDKRQQNYLDRSKFWNTD